MENRSSIPYNMALTNRARELRNNPTKYEKKLWYDYLCDLPVRFNRQKPLDNYIVDFYCHKLGLVIEIDGDSHYSPEAIEYDELRTQILNGYGLVVMRFTNDEIKDEFELVCEQIGKYIQETDTE